MDSGIHVPVLEQQEQHAMDELNTDVVEQMPPMNSGEYNEVRVILNDPIHHTMATSISFDTHEQLFWCGTQSVSPPSIKKFHQ